MTNSTTSKPRASRSSSVCVWTLSLLLHAAALAALMLWEPLGVGTLVFDRAEARDRTEKVRERSERLLEQQRAEREARQLDAKTSEKLRNEEQNRRRRQMEDDLRTLEQSREALDKAREEKLGQVVERSREQIQDGDIAALGYEAQKLLGFVNVHVQSELNRDKDFGALLRKEAVSVHWMSGHSKSDTPADIRRNAGVILERLEVLRHGIRGHAESGMDSVESISGQIPEVERLARIVAGLFDLAEYNDVSASHLRSGPSDPDPGALSEGTPAEAYDKAVALEEEINRIREDIAAAEIANQQNIPFRQAMALVPKVAPGRPDLGGQLRDAAVDTIGELNEYRRLLEAARDETERMAVRAEGMARAADGDADPERALARRLTNTRQWGRQLASSRGQVIDLTAMMRQGAGHAGAGGGGAGDSGGGDADLTSRGTDMGVFDNPVSNVEISPEHVYAHALPGRRFGRASKRRGWLYIDTWYIVGPWQRAPGIGFTGTFPPETGIDLDAEYSNGYVVPDKDLDGTLRWQFHQAEGLRVQPPLVVGGAVYYAFTDVFFEEAQDMLLAIASDDAAKVWINDIVVWQDQGLSSWQMDEGFRKVAFQQGYNRVLVRLENGPGFCYFSMLICPPNAVLGK